MKKTICVLLVLGLLLSFSSAAYASNTERTLASNDKIFGTYSASIEDVYFDSKVQLKNATFHALKLKIVSDALCLSGSITANNSTYLINTTGNIYRFRSATGKDTFLVDFGDSREIHFVQSKFVTEDGVTLLHLIMQLKKDETFLSFCLPLPNIGNINSTKLPIITTDNGKAFSLYNLSRNVLSPDMSTLKVSATSAGPASATIVSPQGEQVQLRASYSTTVDDDEWFAFFTELHNSGSASLDAFSIDQRILNDGWVFLNNSTATTGKYSIACHTSQNGSYDKLIQISFLGLVHQSSNPSWASLQMTIDESIYLMYNTNREEFEVFFYNLGTSIDNLRLSLTLPGGASSQTVFISRRLECNLPDDPSTLESVIALVPYLSTAYDIWDILTSDGAPTTLNFTQTFEDSYAAQFAEYDGAVRRFIAGTTGEHELESVNHSFLIRGDIYAGYAGCSGWSYEYSASIR